MEHGGKDEGGDGEAGVEQEPDAQAKALREHPSSVSQKSMLEIPIAC